MRSFNLIGLALFFNLVVSGQNTDMIAEKGFYIIQQNRPFKKGDSVFCNPMHMPDRIILDSSKKMIAKKTSNPLGYTYYEWRGPTASKTYEEIMVPSLNYKHATYYTDSGQYRPPEKNNFLHDSWVIYFRGPTNTKQRYNGLWIAEKIRIPLSQKATDSLLTLYKSVKGKILPGTKFWTELIFYENGKLKSIGILIMGLKESATLSKEQELSDQLHTPDNQFRIGLWNHYHATGEFNYQETITVLRKVN